jgi:hypothetical protein
MLTVDGDHAVLRAIALDHGNGPRLDHEEVVVRATGVEEHLSGLDPAYLSEPAQPRTLLLVESRKRTVTVLRFLDPQSNRLAHSAPSSLASGACPRPPEPSGPAGAS